MTSKFRRHPLTCLFISILRLITGQLRSSSLFVKEIIVMDDKSSYQIFRHITVKHNSFNPKFTVFIVSFKFSHLSHRANKLTSIIPMLLIAGFPGFVKKLYAVNHENGHWQGMYQWRSIERLEEYKTSFVYRMMNKRAIPETIKSIQYENNSLDQFIKEKISKN